LALTEIGRERQLSGAEVMAAFDDPNRTFNLDELTCPDNLGDCHMSYEPVDADIAK
jgi:hypothetical protein